MEIYIARDGKESGPYTGDQIESLHRAGMLQAHDLVWHEGMDEWSAVHRFLGLRPPVPKNVSEKTAGQGGVAVVENHEGAASRDSEDFRGVRIRPVWAVYVPIVLTFGLYGLYLLPRQSWEIARVTGKKRLNPWLLGILMLVTVGFFGAVYQVFLAWSFQSMSRKAGIPGRNESLGMAVTGFIIGSFAVLNSASEFAVIISAVLGLVPFWLVQSEINLYLGRVREG